VRSLDNQKNETPVRKFSNFIERNKDYQAYSDFKEGINKGLDIARYTLGKCGKVFFIIFG
jgi:hypothetical protein